MDDRVIAQKAPVRGRGRARPGLLVVRLRPQRDAAILRRQSQGNRGYALKWVAERSDSVCFCGCKHTGWRPFCDGSHKVL